MGKKLLGFVYNINIMYLCGVIKKLIYRWKKKKLKKKSRRKNS